MHYCPNCGQAIEEGALFCTNCGRKAEPGTPADAPAPAPGPHTLPISESPAWKALRKSLSSTSFLLVAVFLTLFLAITLITQFLGSAAVPSIGGIDKSSQTLGILIGSIPMLLYAGGAWLLWSSSKKSGPLKGAGGIRAASVIMMVLLSFVIVLMLFTVLPFLLSWISGNLVLSQADLQELMSLFNGSRVIGFVMLGLAILIPALMLLYFAKLSSLAKTIRAIDETGLHTKPISSFLNVCHLCLIILSAAALIGPLAASGRFKTYLSQHNLDFSPLSLISSLVSFGLLVSLYLSIRNLKKNLQQEGIRG